MIREMGKSFQGNAPKVAIGEVEVSASISEIHGATADITDHPVEIGSDISDHYKKRPAEVSIEGVVSDVSLESGYPGKTTVEAFRAGAGTNPSLAAWDRISAYVGVETVTIKTSLVEYPDMALSNFSVTRTAGQGTTSFHFSLTARQITKVSTQTTQTIAVPADKSAKGKKKDKGKKGNKKGNDAKETKVHNSFLAGLFG